MQRCYKPAHHSYSRYGGRGITVCKRWWKFENFYADMGDRPDGSQIGRLNNDVGYKERDALTASKKALQMTVDEVRSRLKYDMKKLSKPSLIAEFSRLKSIVNGVTE